MQVLRVKWSEIHVGLNGLLSKCALNVSCLLVLSAENQPEIDLKICLTIRWQHQN